MSPRSTTASAKPGQPVVKTAARTPAKKPRTGRPAAAGPHSGKAGRVSPAERQRFIAEAAYFKAEQRGFAEGGELDDWIEAEAEIDALLGASGSA